MKWFFSTLAILISGFQISLSSDGASRTNEDPNIEWHRQINAVLNTVLKNDFESFKTIIDSKKIAHNLDNDLLLSLSENLFGKVPSHFLEYYLSKLIQLKNGIGIIREVITNSPNRTEILKKWIKENNTALLKMRLNSGISLWESLVRTYKYPYNNFLTYLMENSKYPRPKFARKEMVVDKKDGYKAEGFWSESYASSAKSNLPYPILSMEPWPWQDLFLFKLQLIESTAKRGVTSSEERLVLDNLRGAMASVLNSNDKLSSSNFKNNVDKVKWAASLGEYYIPEYNVEVSEEFFNYIMNYKI